MGKETLKLGIIFHIYYFQKHHIEIMYLFLKSITINNYKK